jgi:hypothetical protein
MKPLYSIHEGEYLVGLCINKAIKNCDLWIPAKDRGIDILVTNKKDYKKSVSLQIKFSKDHLPENPAIFKKFFRSCGFWNFGQTAIRDSMKRISVDFWVIALHSFSEKKIDCIVIEPNILKNKFSKFKKEGKNKKGDKIAKTYFWVTKNNKCFETRDIESQQKKELLEGKFNSIKTERVFTKYLNNWEPVKKILGVK